jgi:hypothetical protein
MWICVLNGWELTVLCEFELLMVSEDLYILNVLNRLMPEDLNQFKRPEFGGD